MSLPRPVLPGRFYTLTRRCTQRQFLLRPDDKTNNNFLYCLAEAALRYGIVVVLTQMMSNHHHTVIYDPDGRVNEFMEHFHKMFARSQNALRGRWENLWSSAAPSVVEIQLVEADDIFDKLVYVATNPVTAGLVDRVHHWPGPPAYAALLAGRTLTARRPDHFFREDGPMPESVTIAFRLPNCLGDPAPLLRELKRRVEAEESRLAELRRQQGRGVLGRARIIRQSWRDSPSSKAPRRVLNPRVAARDKWARVAALQRNQVFVRAYRKARERWLAGEPCVFPAGTYWLRRFANVPVESYVPKPLAGH